jgi:uncharacterized membrane protein (UPF0127 family)
MPDARIMENTALEENVPPVQRPQFVNRTRGTVVAESVEIAGTSAQRTRGLLGRDGLKPGEALWIVPCESVHTFGMRFAIDLVYLDKKHRIRKIRRNVGPWRISICLVAHSILELPADAILLSDSNVGDQLELIDRAIPQRAVDVPDLESSAKEFSATAPGAAG